MKRINNILDACETLLGDRRYEDISIDDIIETADVARGTVYHFFESKRGIFLAVMHRAQVDIDEQVNPRPGEDKLEFVDYLSKVERRLQKVWRKHRHLVEFYESHKFDPDFDARERERRRDSVKVMEQQLLSRYPDIGSAKARNISATLLRAIFTGLDAIALYHPQGATGRKREWRNMITAYIDSLGLSKEK